MIFYAGKKAAPVWVIWGGGGERVFFFGGWGGSMGNLTEIQHPL